ncbi:probable 2-oxoglutarate-dependent dioxygenase AOP1 [Lycium barbarum]|uniref:probable 2-oxoglutarate-dependent dioxygenase AOP1 n=1 Tax=Lycium barbarum TaxID=112863 RepID=UPI00293F6C65|nr:probable 2-oxoglutarate-dependent dioxygenase AOP1 [Lycium barbarum]
MVMESLGLEKSIEEQNESSNYVLIINKYRKPTRDESGIGLAPHKDKNILTIVFQIQVNGLHMQRKNGQWVDVEFSPNSFLVLIGDVFEDQERFSIGLFTFPKEGYLVKPPEELVDEEHPLVYKPFDGIKYVQFFKSEAGQKAGHGSLKAYCGV